MGCSKGERGLEAKSPTSSLSSLIVGGAIYFCGKTGGRAGDRERGMGSGQGLPKCPDSEVKEVIVSCSFPASPARPGNPTL